MALNPQQSGKKEDAMIKPTVLIIDDEKENVRYLKTILEENGFHDIHGAFDGREGLQKVMEVKPGLVLLDIRMPKKSGIYVFNELKQSDEYRDVPVIILTGEGGFLKSLSQLKDFHEDASDLADMQTEEVLARFIDSRPDAFLEKPIEPETLMKTIRKILITLDGLKKEYLKEINAIRQRKIHGGVVFKGLSFESDADSRNELAAVATMLAAGAELPEGFIWRSSDNQNVPLTKNEVLDFHNAMTQWVYANYKASWDHKTAVMALASIEEAENYNLGSGWPDSIL